MTPETRHLRNIVVRSEDEAKRLLGQARSGVDFTQLAKRYSLDGSTKDSGGDLGTLTADQLDKKYAGAAFNTGENSFFGPVNTQHGGNIGQMLKVASAKQLSLNGRRARPPRSTSPPSRREVRPDRRRPRGTRCPAAHRSLAATHPRNEWRCRSCSPPPSRGSGRPRRPAADARRLTRADVIRYASVFGDVFPLHTDDDYARAAGLDGICAHEMLTAELLATAITDRLGEG